MESPRFNGRASLRASFRKSYNEKQLSDQLDNPTLRAADGTSSPLRQSIGPAPSPRVQVANAGVSLRGTSSLRQSQRGKSKSTSVDPSPSARRSNPAITAQVPNRFPERPSADIKLRLIFEELDVNNNRLMVCDGLERLIKVLNIEFSQETIRCLFSVGDVNKTGNMNYSQYLDWAAKYPTLIDALYERSRETVERVKREALIAAKRLALEDVQRAEQEAHATWREAAKAVEALGSAAQEVGARNDAMRNEAKARASEYADLCKELEVIKAELSGQEAELAQCQKDEREALAAVHEVRNRKSKLQKELKSMSSEKQQAQEKERALEEILIEARKNTKALVESVAALELDMARLEDEELNRLDTHRDAVETRKSILEDMACVEDACKELQNRGEELAKLRKQATSRAMQITSPVEKEEEKRLRQLETSTRQLHKKAATALEEAIDDITRTEALLADYDAQRQQIEETEQPLLDHEVRLREQRVNVNTRDESLLLASSAFLATTGRKSSGLHLHRP